MATFTNYLFPVPEARKLASLEGITHDLEAVIEYCDRLDELRAERNYHLLWEAVSAAAVVRYARCFSSGSRVELAHTLLDLASAELKESHQYFIAIRSKHIAHSVNEFEENDVTVTLREDGNAVEIQGIGAHHGRIVGIAFQDTQSLRELSTWVLEQVKTSIALERQKILLLAQVYGPKRIREFGVPQAGRAASEGAAKRVRSRP